MEKLRNLGAEICYSDPHIPSFPKMREHSFDLHSEELTAEFLGQVDCVLLATDHDKFNYKFIEKESSLIVDARGRFSGNSSHIIKA